VRLLPAASALRSAYPGSHLTWLVEPASGGAVAGQPWVDEVLYFPRERLSEHWRRGALLVLGRELRAFIGELRRRRFDLVLDFHAILKSGIFARLSGARQRVTYAAPYGREFAWLFANRRARLTPARTSRFERNAGLLAFLNLSVKPDPRPFRVPSEALQRMRQACGAAVPVVIHPGSSSKTPHKRYSAAGYAAVALALRETEGLLSLVTWGPVPAERAFAEEIVAASQGAASLAPATPSLSDLAALLACARVYVGGDTGPLHVASLVGTPVVQILGPTDPVENAPYPEILSRSVRVPVACSPCRRGCATALCMQVVPPLQVVEAVRALVGAQ